MFADVSDRLMNCSTDEHERIKADPKRLQTETVPAGKMPEADLVLHRCKRCGSTLATLTDREAAD